MKAKIFNIAEKINQIVQATAFITFGALVILIVINLIINAGSASI